MDLITNPTTEQIDLITNPITEHWLPILCATVLILLIPAAYQRLRYWRERDKHPNFREYLRSARLQRQLDSGKAPRGRAQSLVTPRGRRLRELWLELCLRLRVMRAAGLGLAGHKGVCVPVGRLYAKHIRKDGTEEDHGLVATKVVTNAGVNAIVDAFQNTFEVETFRYHGIGTGNTAENVADTALVTEVESRATGTLAEGASANIFRTVGTVTTVSARAVVEHGIFSATSGGTLLDRSVFSVINTGASDSIEFTYELTLPAGS